MVFNGLESLKMSLNRDFQDQPTSKSQGKWFLSLSPRKTPQSCKSLKRKILEYFNVYEN